MTQAKKLIEVAMPIKEISAESVRDKSIRHGHISTLHLWWARRPLPVCRAVVFASLVPDPLDANCPQAFKDAIEILLGKKNNIGDPYHPYKDIPWTSVYDPMEDNLRNRLQMFIGKFTDEMQQHLLHQKPKPGANNQLNDNSLIKWDNKNNEAIINIARKLIWVAHNSKDNSKTTAVKLIADFDLHYNAIKQAEEALYNITDRHIETRDTKTKEENMQKAIEAFLDKMPKVFDPFAGGGAIPLEAARLGCRSFGNDINPVAHIIQKGSLEFPQRFGKPITYSKEEFIIRYGEELWNKQPQENKKVKNGEAIGIRIENRLAFDVEYYAKKLLSESEKEIGHLYPIDSNGNKPLAYYWARIGTCSNPSCKAEVPLLRQFYLSKRRGTTEKDWVHFLPKINGNKIELIPAKGKYEKEGWLERANLKCPVCGSITEVKKLKDQFKRKITSERLVAVIENSTNGKVYRLPTEIELLTIAKIKELLINRPIEMMPRNDSQNVKIPLWGFEKWSDMFSDRQLTFQNSLLKQFETIKNSIIANDRNYNSAVATYLAILIDRISVRNNTFCRWHTQQDTIEHPFSRQAIPMMFDYPEMNPFANFSGSAYGQLDSIIDVILNQGLDTFTSFCNNSASGDKNQFEKKYLDIVVTDPPYYDAIAYADLSDFFYVWLKRMLVDLYPLNFATPLTPKTDECTAIKHHHSGDINLAKQHFEDKLYQIFHSIEYQTKDLVSIMFAHQSTEAWTTLCNSILKSRMNITGSWAIDTEMAVRMISIGNAALESSVTVSCRPANRTGYGNYKIVKKAIEKTVAIEVDELYRLGFRGADLLTACFGQAVSEFGKYEKVEKADGSEVTVEELLEMARESAFNALLKGFDGDDFTKFYIGWLQLYGFAESDFDDAAKFSRVGLSIDVQELFTEHILIKNESGNKQILGGFEQRFNANKNIGEKANNLLIDQVHRAMALYKGTNRAALLQYMGKAALNPESSFWRVLTSLNEVLPPESDDRKQATGLITNKDSLIRESKIIQAAKPEQGKLYE